MLCLITRVQDKVGYRQANRFFNNIVVSEVWKRDKLKLHLCRK
jgi:hypothetical protein